MWNAGMYSNMNFPAPASVLGMLAAAGGLFLVAVAMVVLLAMHKKNALLTLLRLTGAGAFVYAALLLGFSLASHKTVLARGQEKYFCEIDCHLAYSIADVRSSEVGDKTHLAITVRTWFDQSTISPQRPRDLPLIPNGRWARLVDADGREYGATGSSGTPFSAALKPGESYLTTLAFELPGRVDAMKLRLLLTSQGWEERVMIGDENSCLHAKTYFALNLMGQRL